VLAAKIENLKLKDECIYKVIRALLDIPFQYFIYKYYLFLLYERLFLKTIRKSTDISNEDATVFLSYFKTEKYKRNTVLLREGDVANEAYIVLQGGLRQFFQPKMAWRKPVRCITSSFLYNRGKYNDYR